MDQELGVAYLTNVLPEEQLNKLREEALLYAKKKRTVMMHGHQNYFDIGGYELIKNSESELIKFYKSAFMLDLVRKITGKNMICCPIISAPNKFSINCKLNYYQYNTKNQNYINWHYDRIDDYTGETVVVVLTLVNDFPPTTNAANFCYYPKNSLQKVQLFTKANHMTMHNPAEIMHKVVPFSNGKEGNMRLVFTMKYSTDPTPNKIKIYDNIIKYISVPLRPYTIYSYYIAICILLIILIIIFILLFILFVDFLSICVK